MESMPSTTTSGRRSLASSTGRARVGNHGAAEADGALASGNVADCFQVDILARSEIPTKHPGFVRPTRPRLLIEGARDALRLSSR
jgi:hypothetical protein